MAGSPMSSRLQPHRGRVTGKPHLTGLGKRCRQSSRQLPASAFHGSYTFTSGWPTTRGIDLLRNVLQFCFSCVYLMFRSWRRLAPSRIVVVIANDVDRTTDSRNHCDTRRLAKCAIVSVPTHKAILPCACSRSLTTRAGCGASCTYKRALSPCTSIFSLVHAPGTTSA